MKSKGEITVFLALMLSVLSVFISALTKSVKGYVSKSEALYAVDCAIRSCFAEYNRELFERYHILLIDTSYKAMDNGIQRTEDHFRSYLDYSLTENEVDDVSVSQCMDAAASGGEYLYDTAVYTARKSGGIDDRLSGTGDDAYFLTYILDVCGMQDSPSGGSCRTGEIEYILYGCADDEENIAMALSGYEEGRELSYDDFLCRCLEEEDIGSVRKRFAELVTEYMRMNGSPGFDLSKCYYAMTFTAGLKGRSCGDYSITRDYSYAVPDA